jgi:hypothetical protein
MSDKPSDNPGYVTRAECARITTDMKKKLDTIQTALVGEDMRGGLVKDVGDLKKEKSTVVEILRNLVVPIIVALATAWFVSGMPH